MKKPYAIVKVQGRRVNIPSKLLKALGVEDGEYLGVYFRPEDGSVNYVPVDITTRDGKKIN